MAITPIQLRAKTKGGKGGLIGGIIGTAVGGVAGTFAGNPMAGAAAGGALGRTVGGLADPGKMTQPRGVSTLQAATREDPKVKMAQLIKASEEIRTSGRFSKPQREELLGTIGPAIEELRVRV